MPADSCVSRAAAAARTRPDSTGLDERRVRVNTATPYYLTCGTTPIERTALSVVRFVKRMIILLGAPGAGKTTQAQRLGHALRMCPVSIGELLRAKTSGITATDQRMSRGEFVTDTLAIATLAEHLAAVPGGLILDGFPRTAQQARQLASIDPRLATSSVFVIEVSESEALDRLASRATIDGRNDDNPAAIALRWRLFAENLAPVVTECADSGHNIHSVDGSADPEQVTVAILDRLALQSSHDDER